MPYRHTERTMRIFETKRECGRNFGYFGKYATLEPGPLPLLICASSDSINLYHNRQMTLVIDVIDTSLRYACRMTVIRVVKAKEQVRRLNCRSDTMIYRVIKRSRMGWYFSLFLHVTRARKFPFWSIGENHTVIYGVNMQSVLIAFVKVNVFLHDACRQKPRTSDLRSYRSRRS